MSTRLAVKSALKTLGRATFDPAVVNVEFGPRAQLSIPGGRLRIGNVTGDSQPEALGPSRPMLEVYDVECVLSYTVNADADQQETVTAQVEAWFTTFEFAVRASPDQALGVPGVRWAVVMGRFDQTDHPASETSGPISASLLFNVHVEAMYRLT